MARSTVGTPEAASEATPRIDARKHHLKRLWPSRTVRLPPGGPIACEPDQTTLPASTLTARELIAMARAARLVRA